MDDETWPHPRHPGLTLPVRCDPHGKSGPTRGRAAGKEWRRTSRGFYVPASVSDEVPEQRILEAAHLLPGRGGVTGWAALRWSGARWLDGTRPGGNTRRPVALAVPRYDIRARPGVVVSSERLPERDLTSYDGLAITTHVRSVGFEMRHEPAPRHAVVHLDMAATADLVSLAEVAAYVERCLAGWVGVEQCRWALELADENSWSPRETLMRLIWVLDAGLPRPLCNTPVFDLDGYHLGTPDLLDVEAGMVLEYDGPDHLTGQRRARDLKREAGLRKVGLEYVTMVAADWADPATTILPRMVEARERALRTGGRRAWTVDPPSWWTPTVTVAQRRALTDVQRQVFLGRRGR